MGESGGSHVEPGLEASQINLDEIPVCFSRARPYSKIYSQEDTTSARTATTTSHATAVMNRFNSTQTVSVCIMSFWQMVELQPLRHSDLGGRVDARAVGKGLWRVESDAAW